MPQILLLAVAFLSGACGMMLEIVGSRLMGPYIGSSLHTWTALISVILGALSIGYFLGGKLVDKSPTSKWLGIIFIAAGICVSCIKLVEISVLPLLIQIVPDIRLQALLGGLLLFGPANIFMGMVSPFAVRLYTSSIKDSGRSAGTVYAISTLGSITGTIGSGFFLLPFLGHGTLLILIAGILFCCAAVVFIFHRNLSLVSLILMTFGIGSAIISHNVKLPFIDIDTDYNRVWIVHGTDSHTGRPVVGLKTDPYGLQTVMFSDEDNESVSDYIKYFRLASTVTPRLDQILVIGGGGYAFPKDFLLRNPTGFIDVVELDPGITAIAKQYFHLPDNERLRTYSQDGRLYLNSSETQYDAIFYDAFGQGLAPPFSLITTQAIDGVYNHLTPSGVFVFNIISALTGPQSELFQAVLATVSDIFHDVAVFAVKDQTQQSEPQNIIIIAGKQTLTFPSESDSQYGTYVSHKWKGKAVLAKILTDDYVPVEYLSRNIYK